MNKISSSIWLKPKDEMTVATFHKVNELVEWISAHEDMRVTEMDKEGMNEIHGWRSMAEGDTPNERQVVIAKTESDCRKYQILMWREDMWYRQDGGNPCYPFTFVSYWKPFQGMV